MLDKILEQLDHEKVVLLSKDKLKEILSIAEMQSEKNTLVNDKIRILKYKEILLTQEMTNKDEVALRKADNLQAAQKFVEERMEIYEKMWDGCGCKVDYYN